MLIQPDTYIRLIKKCPLDKTYKHSIYFDSVEEQTRYFKLELAGVPFTKQSYQRYGAGVLHVQAKAEDLCECNYLMFQNSAFDNKKYFYAFVTSVEYVNNVSSKVYYEIDVLQTWLFDSDGNKYDIKPCFVEREHSVTDEIGDNLINERLDVGDFFVEKLDVLQCPFTAGDYHVIVVQGTNKLEVNGEYQCVTSNVFSGLDFTRYETPSAAYDALKQINIDGESDGVVAVFMIPSIFWGTGSAANFSETDLVLDVSSGLENPFNTNFEGYVPNNNKLYTSQFFGLIGTSSSGDEHRYAYEYFKNPNNPMFAMSFSIGASPEASIVPVWYKGEASNYNEEMLCKDFPQCAYATDAFKAYIAQNSGRLVAGFASQVMSTTNAQAGRISGEGLADMASYIFNTVGTLRDVSVLPPRVRGSGASYLNYTRNTVGFMFYQYKIRREYAEIIDGYFDMFGYATHKVKKPNLNSRPHWNYVKTKGCTILGSVPADDSATICRIFDRGITFWKKGSEVGNYALNNKPV